VLGLYCFSRPYWVVRSRLWYDVLSVCRLSVCNVLYCGQTVRRRGSGMVPLDRALVSSCKLSIVTMSLTAAVWPQFATQVFRGGIGRLTCLHNFRKLCKWASNCVYISGAGNNMFESSYSGSYGCRLRVCTMSTVS